MRRPVWPESDYERKYVGIPPSANNHEPNPGEPMNASRRVFLKSGALALVAAGTAPLWLRDAVFAAEAGRPSNKRSGRKTIVCVFQRGAVDGISMLVPHGDPWYYRHRTIGAQ